THGQGLVELEEISGYHLEQAARYLVDLGHPDAELAGEAAKRLWNAGRRAVWRVDRRAARSLLERAAALCDQPPTHLLIDLARTFDDPSAAASLLDEVAERARTEGDAASVALAQALAAYHRTHLTEGSADEQERLALAAARAFLDDAVTRFDELGSPMGLALVAAYEGLVGNDEAAAEQLAVYCAYLADHGHASLLSTYAPLRGRHLCALGRFGEAERLAEQGRELGHADDP